MHKVISFGHRCSSTTFLELLQLKTESYPFDWLVSKLDVIQHCIETDFVHFLDAKNYIIQPSESYNVIDNMKYHICYEKPYVNKFYEKRNSNVSTYHYKLAPDTS